MRTYAYNLTICGQGVPFQSQLQWGIQDLSDGVGDQPLGLGQKPIIWHYLCRKLHEYERNWTEEGGEPLESASGLNARKCKLDLSV